jgi:streptomycin 6-kinase
LTTRHRRVRIPAGLDRIRSTPDGALWLQRLPDLVDECADHWALTVGEPFPGATSSLVLPVAQKAERPDTAAVLKIQFPHRESRHEADALEVWDSEGAVKLLAHDPERHALLLERCEPGTALSSAGPDTALAVVVELLPTLWRPVADDAPFTSLADEAAHWAAGLRDNWERTGRPLPEAVLQTALELLETLPGTQGEQVLVHQDLHGDNVLAAQRRPWLVIDPKPLVAEREFSIAPVIRSTELGDGPMAARRRLDVLVRELDLDAERAWGWTLAQTVAWSFDEDGPFTRNLRVATWLADRS